MIEIESRVHNSITLPLSSFRFNQFEQDLSSNDISSLYQYFDNIFDDLTKFENKTVVLLDYAQTGSSLFATQQYLGDYFKKNVLKMKLKSIAITSEFHDPDFLLLDPSEQFDEYDNKIKNIYEFSDYYKIDDFQIIQLDQEAPLADLLRLSYFDEFAKYETFNKPQWREGPVKNPDYSTLQLFFEIKSRKKSCIGFVRNFFK